MSPRLPNVFAFGGVAGDSGVWVPSSVAIGAGIPSSDSFTSDSFPSDGRMWSAAGVGKVSASSWAGTSGISAGISVGRHGLSKGGTAVLAGSGATSATSGIGTTGVDDIWEWTTTAGAEAATGGSKAVADVTTPTGRVGEVEGRGGVIREGGAWARATMASGVLFERPG